MICRLSTRIRTLAVGLVKRFVSLLLFVFVWLFLYSGCFPIHSHMIECLIGMTNVHINNRLVLSVVQKKVKRFVFLVFISKKVVVYEVVWLIFISL